MNAFYCLHQLIGVLRADFNFARRTQFGGLPKNIVEVGKLLQMRRVEVVGPQNEQIAFGLLSLLFFDCDEAAEGVVIGDLGRRIISWRPVEIENLDGHRSHRLCRDPSGGRIIDAARAIAMRRGAAGWPKFVELIENG